MQCSEIYSYIIQFNLIELNFYIYQKRSELESGLNCNGVKFATDQMSDRMSCNSTRVSGRKTIGVKEE